MKIVSRLIFLLLALAVAPLAQAQEMAGETIHICEDAAEWPPYTFYKRVDGQPGQEIGGFAVDVVSAIFEKAAIKFTIELLPWARCQREVAEGGFQMALNPSYSSERARLFFLTRPYYKTTSYYFYSKKSRPDGLDIKGPADLRKYRICGLLGYNYETYGLKNADIDLGAKNFPGIIAKLHANRCDLFVEKYEIIAGFSAIGQSFLDDDSLGRAPLPGVPATNFHMMVSRRYAKGERLVHLLDRGLDEMESNGQLATLLGRYVNGTH